MVGCRSPPSPGLPVPHRGPPKLTHVKSWVTPDHPSTFTRGVPRPGVLDSLSSWTASTKHIHGLCARLLRCQHPTRATHPASWGPGRGGGAGCPSHPGGRARRKCSLHYLPDGDFAVSLNHFQLHKRLLGSPWRLLFSEASQPENASLPACWAGPWRLRGRG